MKTVFANRASNVLYDFLISNHTEGLFLLPANVCPIVPETFAKANQRFEFVDIDNTHAMNQSLCIERLSHNDCSGVLFVQAYGHPFNNTDFYAQLRLLHEDIVIIDDRCLLPPSFAEHDKNADLTLYSTGYAKYVELGYGGWGIVNDRRLYRQTLPEIEYLQKNINEYQSTILEEIPKVKALKKRINDIYNENLRSISSVSIWRGYDDWRYMISVPADKRESILKSIFDHGFFAGTNYPSQAWNFNQQSCIVAEQEAKEVINLFNDFRADETFALGVCKAMRDVIG